MVQKRDSGFSAFSLCLHSGCTSGPHVETFLLKFLYNTIAGKSLLEIVYNRFRSFRFFLSIIPLFFFRRAALIVMSALRWPRSVFTPVVRPVRLWRSCYRNSFTARAQENHFGESYTTDFDIIPVFAVADSFLRRASRAFFLSRAPRAFFSASRVARFFFSHVARLGLSFPPYYAFPNFS